MAHPVRGAARPETESPQRVATELRAWLAGRAPLWGLDFDGTLVDLHPDPERVTFGAEAFDTVSRLARRHPVAVISGRSLEDLARHVPLPGIGLIGNHGCQIRRPGGALWEWSSESWWSWRSDALESLQRFAGERGAWVEDKCFSLTVHFKGDEASRRWWRSFGQQALLERVGSAGEVMPGANAWNILAAGAPHKGAAALRYCREEGLDSLLYFGDEPTDEAVFVLKEIPVFGVKVREGESAAPHRLSEPAQVIDILSKFT